MRSGDRIFPAGHTLRPQDLGVLAEIGVLSVPVRRRPRVAILATGDELVPPDATPGPGQIRNSNETMLAGLVVAAGCEAVPLGIARDDRDHLRSKIDEGLVSDMLLLSGGVSAGVLDLVPAVLDEAGVEQVFHKVNVKPGKPVWFGGLRPEAGDQKSELGERGGVSSPRRSERGDGNSGVGSQESGAGSLRSQVRPDQNSATCLVFGLPGNPVSTLVCFELFAKTALRRMLGLDPAEPQPFSAVVTSPIENRGDRPTYHPARITLASDGRLCVTPVRWAGSGDLRATADANGVAVLEPNTSYAPSDAVGALLWSGSSIVA
jgi:molybdopterin molybdotransferase